MMRSIPPRLRASEFMLVGGAVIAAIAVPARGAGHAAQGTTRRLLGGQPS